MCVKETNKAKFTPVELVFCLTSSEQRCPTCSPTAPELPQGRVTGVIIVVTYLSQAAALPKPKLWNLELRPSKTFQPFLLSSNPGGISPGWDSLLIMFTSLAPSPIASVMAFLYLFTRSTTIAFCLGVTRQQMTALHSQARSTKFFCCCSFLASRRLLLCVRIRLSSSVLGNFSFRILLLLVFFSRRISFCESREGEDYNHFSFYLKSTIPKTLIAWRMVLGFISWMMLFWL